MIFGYKHTYGVTIKESTTNIEIKLFDLPETRDDESVVDDGVKHVENCVSSDEHQERVASDTTDKTDALNMQGESIYIAMIKTVF